MKAVRDLFGCISSSTAATDVSPQDTAGDNPRGTPARRNAPGTPLERLQALKRAKQKALCSDLNAQYAAAGQLLKRARKLSLPLKAGSSEEKTLKGFQQDILSVQGDIADRLHGKPQGPHIPRHEASESVLNNPPRLTGQGAAAKTPLPELQGIGILAQQSCKFQRGLDGSEGARD